MDLVARPFIHKHKVEAATWLGSDPVMVLKFQHGFECSEQASQKDSLWLQNSWLTANAISEATMDYFYAGTAVVGAGGFVQSAIQLWHMLKTTGYLVLPLTTTLVAENSSLMKEDILLFDHLLDVFGEEVFSGPPPKSGFLKQWDLMMGVRPEEFARGKRQYKKTVTEPLRPRAHNEAGRGILATVSELWNLHEGNYFSSKTKLAPDNRCRHSLTATLDLVNSELGQSTITQLGSETIHQRGPLLNLNLLKIHRLCFRIFAELEPILRPDIERIIDKPLEHTQVNWPYLTGWIARTERIPRNNGMPDPVLLRKAAEVVGRLAGSKELGFFLMRYEADETLILG
ncbi:hypothetical protein GALMADRAFT_1177275 [Galerina marginata CBS 339.88]|uniref:Uncharacterized protein n=1 Tax=Galerina marginata (strain CBS 339.88) TaxID=685588 RepID=A0A067TAA6_GALM3|nr:hypothetical protein GALMADRAFT_1177275 [Galerina marginata CBS 339.88]